MPTSSDSNYPRHEASPSVLREDGIEYGFIGKLQGLKYEYRADITDRASLEKNFREKFEALNRVRLTNGEFARLLDEIVSADVFTAAKTLREMNAFTRDDGTPLNYTLVNIKDWCKNTFEVVNQLRINTDYSHHRYDVLILINGVPCVQIELKTLGIHPRRAMEQIVEYKHDPGNGYTKTLLCFIQLFIVSNRDSTYYFANNNARHFAFNAEERFLPVYQFADEANKKVTHLDDFADTFLVKCTLGETISRYMVLIASEQKLMMMRPYRHTTQETPNIGLRRHGSVRAGKEHHNLQPRPHEYAAARGEGHRVRDLPRRHPDQRLGHPARAEPRQEAVFRRHRRQPALQLPLGPRRVDGRRRAIQEPRPRPQVGRRLRLPSARLPQRYIETKGSNRIIIDSAAKPKIRGQLEALGISAGTVYPEIDKVAEFIRKGYEHRSEA